MIFIDGFAIDIAISETFTMDSEVTDYPVESGSDITDNIRALPVGVVLECIVSNTPIGPVALERRVRALARQRPTRHVLPADQAFTLLRAIRDDKRAVTIETSRGTFKDMVLSLSVPISRETGNGIRFTATFRQIRFIENKRITVRVAVPTAQGKAPLGLKAAGEFSNKLVIWHKRNPPGGVLTGTSEQLFYKKATDPRKGSELYHANQTDKLTTAELNAYSADLQAGTSEKLTSLEQESVRIDDRLKRANAFLAAKEKSKGPVDPALFRFQKNGEDL